MDEFIGRARELSALDAAFASAIAAQDVPTSAPVPLEAVLAADGTE